MNAFKPFVNSALVALRAVEASLKKRFDQFPGFGNYLIQNEEAALVLFSIDRTPQRIVMDSTLGNPLPRDASV